MSYIEDIFSVTGRTALVTGGSSGIGRLIAEALVRAGARVLIASRKGQLCEEAAQALNALGASGRAEGFAGDVSTEAGVNALVDEVRRRTDTLSILVNNSGRTWGAKFDAVPYKSWDYVFSVNVTGPFALCQGLMPLMEKAATKDNPARIINIGSVAGVIPVDNDTYSYVASKAGLHHLTKLLAHNLASKHVTVNAVAPGPFHSRLMDQAAQAGADQSKYTDNVPLKRWGELKDMAGIILFLCGAGGSYVTGAVIPVDGGLTTNSGPG